MKTDTQLQRDVVAELAWEPAVNAAQIGVAVKDGVVTLSGEVSSYPEKWHAEEAVQRVSGVKALAVAMEVKLTSLGRRSDTDIARSVETALAAMICLPEAPVRVMVEGGWVTLSGQVDWRYQKQAAVDGVRYLPGVRGVSDDISLKPRPSGVAVKADIEAALKRHARQEAQAITVAVHGDDVTLTGVVHTWSERDLATHAAWSAPGVHRVIDQLTVTA